MGKQSKKSPKQKTDNATGTKKLASAETVAPTKPKGPPFDITLQEYKDLCDQVADLSLEELQEEWVLAARYGDLDVFYAIKSSEKFRDGDSSNLIVNCQDSANGNTALHMAAANGHLAVVEALLDCGSSLLQHSVTNHAGNTPLHWAAANGHDKVVKILLQRIQDIDVLKKNEFGRSALTEGFTSEKTEVIKHLLEHDSAAEEKLLQGGEEIDDPEDEDEDGDATPAVQGKENTSNNDNSTNATDTALHYNKSTTTTKNKNNGKQNIERPKKGEEGIIHSFQFLIPESKHKTNSDNNENPNTDENESKKSPSPPPLKIRELPIPLNQDCFGDKPEEDTTGHGIWAASLVMARWMAASRQRFRGKGLLELGAGCGVPGLAAAYYSEAKRVYLTDVNPKTIDNLKYNIQLNNNHHQQQRTSSSSSGTTTASWEDRLNAGPINWEDPTTWPKEKIDYIIGSDLIYQESIVPILKKVVLGLCQGHGTFLYVAPDTESDIGRDGLAEFIHAMKKIEGCSLVSDDLAPRPFHSNPLASQDDDMCFLHFHELTSATYRLYEFEINIPTTK